MFYRLHCTAMINGRVVRHSHSKTVREFKTLDKVQLAFSRTHDKLSKHGTCISNVEMPDVLEDDMGGTLAYALYDMGDWKVYLIASQHADYTAHINHPETLNKLLRIICTD